MEICPRKIRRNENKRILWKKPLFLQIPSLWVPEIWLQGRPTSARKAWLWTKKLPRPGTHQSPAITQVSQKFEAGWLHKFLNEWQKITSDSFILDIVAHCHLDIDVDSIEHLFGEGIEYVFNREECRVISQEIAKLLELKVIIETQRQDEQIISPIFFWGRKRMENTEWFLI